MPMRPLLLQYHTRPITQVKYNRDGDLIVSSSNDGNISLIKAETGDRIGTYHGHEGAVKSVDISRDSSMIVSGGADSRICFFETKTGHAIYTLMSGGIIKSVEFNQRPAGHNLVVSCADKFRDTPNNISVWRFWNGSFGDPSADNPCFFQPKSASETDNNFGDFRIEQLCMISDSQLPMKASSVRFGPFDETVISAHDEGTIYVWKIPADLAQDGSCLPAEPLKCVDAHIGAIKSLQFNMSLPGVTGSSGLPAGDRTLMLTASRDKTCKLWETQEYSLLKTYTANRPLNDAALSPLYQLDANNDAHMITGDSKASKSKTGAKGEEELPPAIPTVPRYHVICGGGIEARDVTTSVEGGFESVFFHMVSEEELCTVKGHFGPMNAVGMSPDGKAYITGGEDGLLRLIHFDGEYFTRKDM